MEPKNGGFSADPRNARPRDRARDRGPLLQGKVRFVNLAAGYGFLIPEEQAAPDHQRQEEELSAAAPPAKLPADVYFRLPPVTPDAIAAAASSSGHGPPSTTHAGLFTLKPGDTLEYVRSGVHDKHRAVFARLVSCSSRSSDDMASYLTLLLSLCHHHSLHETVLRAITMAPQPLLLALQHPNPDRNMTLLTLQLANSIVEWEKPTTLYAAKTKEFFGFFARSRFFDDLAKLLRQPPNSLKPSKHPASLLGDYFSRMASTQAKGQLEKEWGKPENDLIQSAQTVVLRILKAFPCDLPSYVPLIQILDMLQDQKWGNNKEPSSSHMQSFAMEVIAAIAQSKGTPDDPSVSWDKLSLLPLNSEIKGVIDGFAPSVALPVAKLGACYESPDEYIDTYFRLLREDSFACLKKGISDFTGGKLDKRDMTVWRQVTAVGIHFKNSSPGMVLGLKLESHQVNKEHAQPPLPGSLLCICDSGGSFKRPIWAIAARCEKSDKKKDAVLFVEVLEGSMDANNEQQTNASVLPWVRFMQASTMVVAESPAYYRAYEPVLRALQKLDPKTMPFQEELVHAKSPRMAPDYLNNFTTLDWSSLPHDSSKVYGSLTAGVMELTSPTLQGFQTTLDSSQVRAVNHVLNNRLAIIQGPPGTGKSFLSVKLVQLLLSATTRKQKPILIMTYKNQALDHFLDSCLSFCDKPGDLVRVGGNSKCAKLTSYNLQVLLRTVDAIFASDWTSNCAKLSNLEKELRDALNGLYVSQFFNATMVTTQPSLESFAQKLLLSQNNIQDGPASPKSLQHNHKEIVKALKQWLPRKIVFNSVQACLSLIKPVSGPLPFGLPAASEHKSSKEDTTEEPTDDEDRKETEDLWSVLNGENRSPKNNDWLTKDFLSFEALDQDRNSSFQGMPLTDFDASGYAWLLQANPWELVEEHRCILILLLIQQNCEEATRLLQKAKEDYDQVCLDNAEINKRKRVAVLQKAKIIGLTTTGAAMNQDIIAAVEPSIVLVEEAAEILEPQLIAVLSPSIDHLILVGDHKQLRPSVNNYNLEIRHNLGISMLERLAENNKLPFEILGLQSRMRDEFLQMIKPIYPNLRSNMTVVSGIRNKPSKCMKSTMYFWSHCFEETSARSPSNEGEAYMVMALVKWLVSQGHNREDITVIGAYNGQVSKLRKMMQGFTKEGEEAIDVQTIDRFQGSENQIIIASLVRSNSEGNIGHLSAQNRLCVTVSRARSGFYLCGDEKTLTKKSSQWQSLLDDCFKSKDCLGKTIPLTCPRHPTDPPFDLSCDKARNFSPDICKRPCSTKLPCGHLCAATCHHGIHPLCKSTIEHTFQDCSHSITVLCSQDVTRLKCQAEVWILVEQCGHPKKCMCWERSEKDPSVRDCGFPCKKARKCSHPCTLLCSQACESSPCLKCDQISKIRAAKEKESRIREMQEKMATIDHEISKLKSEKPDGPFFTELLPKGDMAAEYRMVQDRTEKFVQRHIRSCQW